MSRHQVALHHPQSAIRALLSKVSLDFTRGRGWFVRRNRTFGRLARAFGYLYLWSMIVRYAITRTLLIPVVFHCVLASYVILVGRYHRGSRSIRNPPFTIHSAAAALLIAATLASGGCRALVSRTVLPREVARTPRATTTTGARLTATIAPRRSGSTTTRRARRGGFCR